MSRTRLLIARGTRSSIRRRAILVVGLNAAMLAGCHRTSAPALNLASLSIARDAARFAVVASTDSTVTFRPAEVRWLRPGMRGHVVDPVLRDALIARLTIQRVDTGGIVAVIAGGVSPVEVTHVVLFEKPKIAWWRDKRFWIGAGAGVATGIAAASASK